MLAQARQQRFPSTDTLFKMSFWGHISSTRIQYSMAEKISKSWVRGRVEDALRGGLAPAYETVRADSVKFLVKLPTAYGLPITTFHGLSSLELSLLGRHSRSGV